MARNNYEYSTSPRKLEPEYRPQKQNKRKKLKVVEDLPRQDIKVSKAQRKRQLKTTAFAIAIFIVLLVISYRNSQINEKFSQVKTLKSELSSIQKENEQLKVTIENSVNYNNIEKIAKEKLGMQKLTNKQTVYVSLPKEDYVEPASEKVIVESESWFQKIINNILKK